MNNTRAITRMHVAAGLCALAAAWLCGCTHLPSVKTPHATATAPRDTNAPATVHRDATTETLALPKDSRVVVNKLAATESSPAIDQTIITPSADTTFTVARERTVASTGMVDASVAKHRINVEERRWLLWAAIGCLVAGFVIRGILPAWPGLSNGLLVSASIAGAAWQIAAIPDWLFAVGAIIAVVMALGYKRAEWDANRNFIPDVLERKTP